MSGKGILQMDSYKWANDYDLAHPCFICGGGNPENAELCNQCAAPMVLTHQALKQKTPTRMIAAIGSAGAGKTVYLGVLTDMLSRENGRLEMVARGAFSIAMQEHTMEALSSCRFPEKTPNEPDRWNWVHSQIKSRKRKRAFDLIMPDLAGDALMEEINHPRSYPVIHQFLSKCSGVMLLVDAAELEEGQQMQDFFAMKIATYLCELDGNARTGWPARPVAVVLTKADQCGNCFESADVFAQRHAPGLWKQVREKFKRYEYFATGVAGACGYRHELGGRRQFPLRIEPRGVIEPFEWLTNEVMK